MTLPDDSKRPGNGGHFMESIAWPAMGYLSLIMLLTIGLIVFALLSQNEAIAGIIGQSRGVIRLVGIVVIAPIIAILALFDKIEGPIAVTALVAIAGFGSGGGQ
jgi:hypothetical protein